MEEKLDFFKPVRVLGFDGRFGVTQGLSRFAERRAQKIIWHTDGTHAKDFR